ncbi:hypothetical protein, partial [Vibrio sp. 03_296]|uniref:hypothetical protein n=1 Tax=Vibrio sp. 03_296 TaxID=2024409 RepID=UPI002D7EF12E
RYRPQPKHTSLPDRIPTQLSLISLICISVFKLVKTRGSVLATLTTFCLHNHAHFPAQSDIRGIAVIEITFFHEAYLKSLATDITILRKIC